MDLTGIFLFIRRINGRLQKNCFHVRISDLNQAIMNTLIDYRPPTGIPVVILSIKANIGNPHPRHITPTLDTYIEKAIGR
jgi:hypothetical protein